MKQWFEALPPALRVLVLVGALAVSIFLLIQIIAMASTTLERFSNIVGNTSEERTSVGEDKYLSMVEQLQTSSVESFLESDGKFSHYDSITSDDLDTMKTNYTTIGDNVDQIDNVEPPEGYESQYNLFRAGIDDLYQAANLAYSLSADPSSVTKSALDEYNLYASRADSNLQQSNETLGQNYIVTGSTRHLTGSSTTTIKDITLTQLFDSSKKRYVNVHAKAEAGGAHPPGIACGNLASATGSGSSREVALTPSRDSGVSGTASFEETQDAVEVTLHLQNLPEADVRHLAHIHQDATCEDDRSEEGGPIEYPLEPVQAGS
jgi:hypothetical protein